jgi:hypothetical protein
VPVVYYSHPAFFEPALCLARERSRRVELHLLFEVSASALFEVSPKRVADRRV